LNQAFKFFLIYLTNLLTDVNSDISAVNPSKVNYV